MSAAFPPETAWHMHVCEPPYGHIRSPFCWAGAMQLQQSASVRWAVQMLSVSVRRGDAEMYRRS